MVVDHSSINHWAIRFLPLRESAYWIGSIPARDGWFSPSRQQIDEAVRHKNVGDICRKHMIWRTDFHMTQQGRINRMSRMAPAGVGFLVHRLDVHALHQRGHMSAANRLTVLPQHVPEHPAFGKRILPVQFVNFAHQCKVRFTGLLSG